LQEHWRRKRARNFSKPRAGPPAFALLHLYTSDLRSSAARSSRRQITLALSRGGSSFIPQAGVRDLARGRG